MQPRVGSLAALFLCLTLCSCDGGDDSGARQLPTASPIAASPTSTVDVPPTATSSPFPSPSATAPATSSPMASPTTTSPPTATETPIWPPTSSPTTTATPSAATITPTPRDRPTLEPLQIHADEKWVRDEAGRVVVLRGANYSGLEFGNFIGRRNGPEESDFAQMASWGFNVIRLPIAWSFIEPQPNQYDESYLEGQVDRVVDFADRHGIRVVLEMHQFQWSPCFTNGNGAPAWTCEGRGYPDNLAGYGQAGCDFFLGVEAPDGRALMDHFVDVWRLVAQRYAGDRRVAGFDFFNEPIFAFCFPNDGSFEREALNPFYRRLRAAVEKEGATQTFFYSPPISRNLMVPIAAEPMGPNVVYAPHLYTQTFGLPELKYNGDASTITADYELAANEAETIGGPLFCAEFGGNTGEQDGFRAATGLFLRDSLAEQDRRLIGGAVWAYFPSDNTFSVVDAEGNEKGELVDFLARPYARRIAGIPTEMTFAVDTKEFLLRFREDPEQNLPDPTEIFLPSRHYPDGIDLDIASSGGGYAIEAGTTGARVLFFRGRAEAYEVRIRPRQTP